MLRMFILNVVALYCSTVQASDAYTPLSLKPDMWLSPRLAATLDGSGKISALPDLSGNERNATQSDAGQRPTPSTWNGVTWAQFGPSRLTLDSADWGTQFTFACVVKPDGESPDYNRIFEVISYATHSCFSAWNVLGPARYGFEVKSSGMPGGIGTGVMYTGDPVILIFRFNGTHRSFRQSGETYMSGVATTAPTTTTGVASLGQSTAGGISWWGKIGDCVYLRRAISDDECERLESYLSEIYGICLRPRSARFLLPAFAGNGAMYEKLNLYGSNDGKNFGRIEATYTPSVGTFRDGQIIRRGNKYLLLHTTGAFDTPTTSFAIAEASDPIGTAPMQFTTVANVDCSSITGTTQTWSPKWHISQDDSEHVVVGLSGSGNSGPFVQYEVHPTNAARTTWSGLTQVTGSGLPSNHIDAFSWRNDGVNYLIGKDEDAARVVLCASSREFSGYVRLKSGSWMGINQAEGVSVVKPADKPRVYFEDYWGLYGGGMQYVDATDASLEKAGWSSPVKCMSGSTMRNGNVYDRAASD